MLSGTVHISCHAIHCLHPQSLSSYSDNYHKTFAFTRPFVVDQSTASIRLKWRTWNTDEFLKKNCQRSENGTSLMCLMLLPCDERLRDL